VLSYSDITEVIANFNHLIIVLERWLYSGRLTNEYILAEVLMRRGGLN
jgi:hypothetical protein